MDDLRGQGNLKRMKVDLSFGRGQGGEKDDARGTGVEGTDDLPGNQGQPFLNELATSSKGRSPWKVKQASGGPGIVIPKGAIVVNQGLKKVKLEEDYIEQKPDLRDLPVFVETETGTTSEARRNQAVAGYQAVNEEYVVTKVELDVPMSLEHGPAPNEEDDNVIASLRYCQEEIEALKGTVRHLTSEMEKQKEQIKAQDEQIKKQNEVIAEMKLSFGNVGSTGGVTQDDDENADVVAGDGDGSSVAGDSDDDLNEVESESSSVDNDETGQRGGVVHPPGGKSYPCDGCHRSFPSIQELRMHQRERPRPPPSTGGMRTRIVARKSTGGMAPWNYYSDCRYFNMWK